MVPPRSPACVGCGGCAGWQRQFTRWLWAGLARVAIACPRAFYPDSARLARFGASRGPQEPQGGLGMAWRWCTVTLAAGDASAVEIRTQNARRRMPHGARCARHVEIVGDIVEITSPVCGHGINQINAGSVLLHASKVQSAKNRASEVFEDTRILLLRALPSRPHPAKWHRAARTAVLAHFVGSGKALVV